MPAEFILLLLLVIAGPVVFGRLARGRSTVLRALSLGIGVLFPPLVWAVVFVLERMRNHGGSFTGYSDGDIGIVFGGYLSVGLLVVSIPLTLLGYYLRRQTAKGRQAEPPPL